MVEYINFFGEKTDNPHKVRGKETPVPVNDLGDDGKVINLPEDITKFNKIGEDCLDQKIDLEELPQIWQDYINDRKNKGLIRADKNSFSKEEILRASSAEESFTSSVVINKIFDTAPKRKEQRLLAIKEKEEREEQERQEKLLEEKRKKRKISYLNQKVKKYKNQIAEINKLSTQSRLSERYGYGVDLIAKADQEVFELEGKIKEIEREKSFQQEQRVLAPKIEEEVINLSFKNCASFPELYDAILDSRGVKGSERVYSPTELLEIVTKVRNKEIDSSYLTRTGGLRETVKRLMIEEDLRDIIDNSLESESPVLDDQLEAGESSNPSKNNSGDEENGRKKGFLESIKRAFFGLLNK